MRKRLFLVIVATLPLSGCLKDEVGKCEYEAQKAFPTAKLASSPDMGRMIKACMKASGYQYDLNLGDCHASFEMEVNPGCYRR